MGSIDRIVRIALAAVVVALYFLEVINGTVAIIGIALAGILLATSFLNFCPLYLPFGISKCKK